MHISQIILDRRPWGRACGLLVSCVVMIIGIIRSTGPAESVLRAFTDAIISAICVRGFVRLLQTMAEPGAENRSE